MKLLGSYTSPYVRKVRIVMAEKKIDYQLVEEDVWSPASGIHQSNPLSKVPCLVLQDGEAVFDSRVIVEYLDTLSPVAKLIPANGRERVEVRTWEALADGICDAAILARLEQTWAGRTAEQRSQKWIDRQMEKVHNGLKAMSHGLADKAYCSGVHYTGVALSYLDFRFAQIDWRTSYPNLAKLNEKLMQRASFAETAPPK
jgi:glutathione S-transferase